jgi:hypothetical protein
MREFHPTREEDGFVVGRLGTDAFSGVYLSHAYLDRLREVMYAVLKRLEAEDTQAIPDAVLNVIGITSRLVRIHTEQLRAEGHPGTDADRAALAEAECELASALEQLKRFHPGDDGSGNA